MKTKTKNFLIVSQLCKKPFYNASDYHNHNYNHNNNIKEIKMNTKEELKQHCRAIANFLEQEDHGKNDDGDDFTVWDYLQDVYTINYIINSSRNYLGARILVAGGGPNIWANTENNCIEGYWGGDEVKVYYIDNLGLDDALEDKAIELFNLKR